VAGPFHLGSGTSVLTFNHHHNFEGSSYDGGVLEVSTDGQVFVDVTDAAIGGIFLAGDYTGVVSSSFSNPLGGREAWTGESDGLVTTAVDLSAQAGSDVWIRFRLGCDSSISDDGWYIDDIVLDTTGPCPALIFGDGFETGDTSAW